MKKIISLLLIAICSLQQTNGQSTEIQQLLLNVEKLTQLKNILEDMKKGYQIVSNGYDAVRDISTGNFTLHEVFLDGLMQVNPEIRKYHKLADILTDQKAIVAEYISSFSRFQASGNFNVQEIAYLGRVYQQLFRQSLDNLNELATIITSANLRMSDDERLQAIDRIFADTMDKLAFLRNFNQQSALLSLQRTREKAAVQTARKLYNLN